MNCFHPLSLEDFLSEIADIPLHQLTPEQFKCLVARLRLSDTFLNKFILFKPDRYFWKTVLQNEAVEIITCCWLPGQKSFIHFHKNASLNVSRVLMGTITEEIYEVRDRELVLSRKTEVCENGFTTTDRHQYHQLVNNSTTKAVTLHFYSPVRPD